VLWPRLSGLSIEKILFAREQFICKCITHFFGFIVKGSQIGLCSLLVGEGIGGIDGYGSGNSGGGTFTSLWAVSRNMPLFVASVAPSFRLLFLLVSCGSRSGGLGSSPPNVHGIWVSVEHIPPLRLRMSLIPMSSFEPVMQLDVFFLMELCQVGPIVPVCWMVKLDAVNHEFWW